MISRKLRGSLAKRSGRRGIFGSGPSDHNLAVQIKTFRDLILCVGNRSGGSGVLRARVSGAERRSAVPRWGFAGGAPGFTIPAFPGPIRAGFGSGRVYVTRVVHLGT